MVEHFVPHANMEPAARSQTLASQPGLLSPPVRLQNRDPHRQDEEIYQLGPDRRADMLLHLFGSVAMCEHL